LQTFTQTPPPFIFTMFRPDDFTLAALILGALMIAMTLGGSYLSRLPLSTAMVYLGVGVAMGPWGLGLMQLDAIEDVNLLERLTEIAVLLSLFTAGMKLDLPMRDARWRIPIQLASVSMVVTVGLITLVGVYGLGLPLGAAVLLGAILAPTDPVLASDVQVENTGDRDRLRFGLTGEGGMNDGTAFPFVMLGLGLLGLHELGDNGWRWWTVDVAWAVVGGLGLGYLMGTLVGRAVLYLRVHHREALGSDEFIALGLIALTYGAALLLMTYGFLAVFAAGLALRRIDHARPKADLATSPSMNAEERKATAEAPAQMTREVERFNTQLESFAEIGIVVAVGVLLSTVRFDARVFWFVPLLFLVIRPVAVYAGLVGAPDVKGPQRRLMAWFGIRGIGSLYYLLYAISHDLAPDLTQQLLSLTLAVVVASVVAHGVSVTPLMARYEGWKSQSRRRGGSKRV
jgi:sodium/hydrogen antiporter